jgi:hypothetical protein
MSIGKPVLLPVDNLCPLIIASDDLDLCSLLDGHNGVEGVFEQSDVVRLVQILREIEPKFAA